MPLFIKFGKPCGSSSVGRARPSQGRCRGFETLFPLENNRSLLGTCYFLAGVLAPSLSSPRRRGSPCPSHCHPGLVFNKSFPRCVSSLKNRFTSFDCSLGKHTSRSKKTSGGSGLRIFAGAKIYYRSDLLLLAETLVTVSPCEFSPRCYV